MGIDLWTVPRREEPENQSPERLTELDTGGHNQ